MRVTVRLFAGLRERAGWSQREIDGVTRVGDVWAALDLGDEPEGLLYAVNREYAPADHELADGDVVALIPPVSGGAFLLTEEPRHARPASSPRSRARRRARSPPSRAPPRRHSRGRVVSYLEYEGYEGMAEEMMAKLAAELQERYDLHGDRDPPPRRPGRAGRAVGRDRRQRRPPRRCPRRLPGCDRHPEGWTCPLWKKEVYDGGEEWIGRGS